MHAEASVKTTEARLSRRGCEPFTAIVTAIMHTAPTAVIVASLHSALYSIGVRHEAIALKAYGQTRFR